MEWDGGGKRPQTAGGRAGAGIRRRRGLGLTSGTFGKSASAKRQRTRQSTRSEVRRSQRSGRDARAESRHPQRARTCCSKNLPFFHRSMRGRRPSHASRSDLTRKTPDQRIGGLPSAKAFPAERAPLVHTSVKNRKKTPPTRPPAGVALRVTCDPIAGAFASRHSSAHIVRFRASMLVHRYTIAHHRTPQQRNTTSHRELIPFIC